MKLAKYSLIAALALGSLLAFSSQAVAQEKKAEKKQHFTSGEARPGDRLAEELKLTDEQKEKMKAFREEQRKKGEEIRNDTNLTPEQKREKAMAMRQEADKKMKEILTAEQYAKWEKVRDQWKKGGPPADAGEKGKKKGKKE